MAGELAKFFVLLGTKFDATGLNTGRLKIQSFDRAVTTVALSTRKWVDANRVALSAMGVVGALVFKNLVMAAGDFDAAMRRVRVVSGATDDEFKKLQNTAKELGRTTVFSAAQAAGGMEFLAKAGFSANEVLGAIPGTLELAAAANLTLAESADIVTNVLKGYGMEVENLAHVNDVLVKTFVSSNTNLQQLGQSLKFAGPVARAMGQDFESMVAILGKMGDAGIQASMAGTSLRAALARLASPSKVAAEILKKLGVSVFDSAGKMRALVDILEDLKTAGIEAPQIMEIFGLRAGPAMATLLEQGTDAIRTFTEELKNSGGTAKRVADVQMKGFTGAVKLATSALEGLKIAIAEAGILEFSEKALRMAADVFEALSQLPKPVLKWGAIFAIALAASGPIMVGLSMLITAIGTVGGAISTVIGLFTSGATAIGVFGFAAGTAGFAVTGLGAALAASVAVVAGVIIGLVALAATYVTLKTAIEEADIAAKAHSFSLLEVSARMKQGFAIFNEFTGKTKEQALAMGTAKEVTDRLTEGINGLFVAMDRATTQTSIDSIKEKIQALMDLRKAMAGGAKPAPEGGDGGGKGGGGAVDAEVQQDIERADAFIARATQTQEQITQIEVNALAQRLNAANQTAKAKDLLDANRTKNAKEQDRLRAANFASTLSFISSLAGSENKKLAAVGKAAAIAMATMDTYAAATKALNATPWPPVNFAFAAAVVVAGMANIAKISGVQFEKGGEIQDTGSFFGHRGEFVLPKGVVDAIKSGSRPPVLAGAGASMAVAGGGGINIVVQQENHFGPGEAVAELMGNMAEVVRMGIAEGLEFAKESARAAAERAGEE